MKEKIENQWDTMKATKKYLVLILEKVTCVVRKQQPTPYVGEWVASANPFPLPSSLVLNLVKMELRIWFCLKFSPQNLNIYFRSIKLYFILFNQILIFFSLDISRSPYVSNQNKLLSSIPDKIDVKLLN
jgi:hypothetical protein